MVRNARQRLGITSAMAMLFLTLFSTLALGFFASVTMSVEIARNDQRAAKALLAAESGVQFMRYHLANVTIPPASATAMSDLCSDLQARLESSGNLGSNHVTLKGTLMTLDTTTSAGARFDAKTVKWTSTGKNNQPSQGVSYDTKYIPVGGSYRELN
jgi:Tfp pilus assembly protein PilX